MSIDMRNGAVVYPRRIGAAPCVSPAGREYRLERWAIMESAYRWYACRDGLYAADGGFVAPTIAEAAGCSTPEAARELIALLEQREGTPAGTISRSLADRRATRIIETLADRARNGLPAVRQVCESVKASSPATLVFRPYRDQEFLVEEHPELARDGGPAPWLVSRDGNRLTCADLGLTANAGKFEREQSQAIDLAGRLVSHALFATPHEAQEAVLAMLARRSGQTTAAKLRGWADAIDWGEVEATIGVPDPTVELPDLRWTVEFRKRVRSGGSTA